MGSEPIFVVSDFVGVFNQTLEFAYPSVIVEGEISNFRVSKNRWVYFDLKDEQASVRCFGTIYMLPGPLEDGLMVQVRAAPRLHSQFGFSLNLQTIQPVGEGSLKRAAALLEAKLKQEGLFDPNRKRPLPFPPRRIGLITSVESAAFHDFTQILSERWGGVEVLLYDVQVQGEAAPGQIITALDYFNTHEEPVEVLVITRGGGSADDLGAFSTEQVTRAIAASRIPTLVAIGHEIDLSLAELAADQRASTPSNAAQLLVPDKQQTLASLRAVRAQLDGALTSILKLQRQQLTQDRQQLEQLWLHRLTQARQQLETRQQLLEALNPVNVLSRGYAIVRKQGKVVRSTGVVKLGDRIDIELKNGSIGAVVKGDV